MIEDRTPVMEGVARGEAGSMMAEFPPKRFVYFNDPRIFEAIQQLLRSLALPSLQPFLVDYFSR